MISNRQIKTKISATENIRQITKAMEMVAATKMRKAEEVALNSRPYAKKALSLLRNLLLHARKEELVEKSHYFKKAERKNICLVVVTSDKGLAGAFNTNVLKAAVEFKKEHPQADIVTVGRKGKEFFERQQVEVKADFSNFSDTVTLANVAPLSDWLLSRYETHVYDTIVFSSTLFVSAFVHNVEINEVLPLTMQGLEKIIQRIVPKTGRYSELQDDEHAQDVSYVFEPSARAVFESILPELVKIEILHLIFESNASEHSSRMLAMKTATESAGDLLEELRLDLNRARQASITQELAEISTAREALSQN